MHSAFYMFLFSLDHIIAPSGAQKFRTASCEKGFFFDSLGNCLRLLDCQAMQTELVVVRPLNGGFVKSVTHVRWNDLDLALSVPKADTFRGDFRSGMELVEEMQRSQFVVELVGFCHSPMQILTKFYNQGSLDNMSNLLARASFDDSRQDKIRFQIAKDYLNIINFLHNGKTGPRVMCDSNDLNKTLSQYLITDDFHIVLNDLDALPLVGQGLTGGIKCGHRQLFGSFVAPEQLWPFENDPFDDRRMPGYNEKTDIWKTPNVLFHLLGDSARSDQLKLGLFNLLKKCKSVKPDERPSAQEIINEFLGVERKVFWNDNFHHNSEL